MLIKTIRIKMNISIGALQLHLQRILKYLQPRLEFVNCHMVGYLTDNLWEKYVPNDVQAEIITENDVNDALEVFWLFQKGNNVDVAFNRFPALVEFLKETKRFGINGFFMSVEQFTNELNKTRANDNNCKMPDNVLHIKEFMSEKKMHEVEVTSALVANLCSIGGRSRCVIDAGDGKGYLSSRLALEYNIRVLGVDANAGHTEGAAKRTLKLEKAWQGLTKRAEDIQRGITPPRKGRRRRQQQNDDSPDAKNAAPINNNANYKTTTHFITPTTDFRHLFGQHFSESSTGFCLSGLHTCGNLAASCLRIFTDNLDINSCCNIGCCYHLLHEEFVSDNFFVDRSNVSEESGQHFGFPMSDYLRQQQYGLGRNARMLAAQSLDRTVAESELPAPSLFYRALLERLIVDQNASAKYCTQVGRIKNCKSFADYVRKTSKRTCVPTISADDKGMDDYRLNEIFEKHRIECAKMKLFYLIRMCYAPVLECVVLLDRFLYMKEKAQPKDVTCLVRLFDPVVSPRCYGVIAVKEILPEQ